MASSCNAFGRRDGCIETGRLGTAGASRNHSHSGPRAGRISDRAHTADATEAPSRTGKRLGGAHVRPFPGRRRSFLSAARFRRAYYGGVLRTGVYTYRDIDGYGRSRRPGAQLRAHRPTGRGDPGRLFSGQPGWQHMPKAPASVLEVDWRQIKRWGIDPNQIPPDAVISFRPLRFGRRTATLWWAP